MKGLGRRDANKLKSKLKTENVDLDYYETIFGVSLTPDKHVKVPRYNNTVYLPGCNFLQTYVAEGNIERALKNGYQPIIYMDSTNLKGSIVKIIDFERKNKMSSLTLTDGYSEKKKTFSFRTRCLLLNATDSDLKFQISEKEDVEFDLAKTDMIFQKIEQGDYIICNTSQSLIVGRIEDFKDKKKLEIKDLISGKNRRIFAEKSIKIHENLHDNFLNQVAYAKLKSKE